MQKLLRDYLDELNKRRKRNRRVRIAMAILVVMVVGSIAGILAQYGIAMTGTERCGREEHLHSDECYVQNLVCELEEHTHTDLCYVDENADVEEQSSWDRQYAAVEWTGVWGTDLVTAAQLQLGYQESINNYQVTEEGSHKGYTRYGAFAGDPYCDWDVAFVNFCLYYAGLMDTEMELFPGFTKGTDAAGWREEFKNVREENGNYLMKPEGYIPQSGDLIFCSREDEETECQVGIVVSYDGGKNEIRVIEGNSANEVKENAYAANDARITDYLNVSGLLENYKMKTDQSGVRQETDGTDDAEKDVSGELGDMDAFEETQFFGEDMEEAAAYSSRAQKNIGSIIDYDKTAKVIDWDERTYDIEITASSKVTEELGGKAEIYLLLDASGSMNYSIDYDGTAGGSRYVDPVYVVDGDEEASRFCKVKDHLDPSKVYYYGNEMAKTTLSGNNYYPNHPMVYVDGKWKYFTDLENEKGALYVGEDDKIRSKEDGLTNSAWKTIPNDDKTVIYEWHSRVTSLKEAATAFVETSAQLFDKGKCKIGVIRFSSAAFRYSKLTDVSSSEATLVKYINRMYGNGGTRPSTAFESALRTDDAGGSFDKKRDGVPQYVILFSDGKPEVGNEKEPDYEERSRKEREATDAKAAEMKEKGITIFTVGLGLSNDKDNTLGWLENTIASNPNCAFSAENAEELNRIFENIRQVIVKGKDIHPAVVRDVIDPRFVILDDAGNPITPDCPGIAGGIVLENGGTVYFDEEGNQYIEWTDQTIPKAGDPAWNRHITVKAKGEYIGGNNVPTNIAPDSQIDAGDYGIFPLPQPVVNVRAEFHVSNREVTIFKGDAIPADAAVLESLFGEKDAETYFDVINGIYQPLGMEDFEREWYKDETCQEAVSIEAEEKPQEETIRYLTVAYDPGEPSEESNRNTTLDGKVYVAGTDGRVMAVNSSPEYQGKTYGVYKIHLISGQVRITKKLTEGADTEQTFRFHVKKDGEFFGMAEITVPAGSKEAVLDNAGQEELLRNLPRGSYEITEEAVKGYAVEGLEIGADTDCRSKRDGGSKSATFTIGQNMSGNVIDKDYHDTGGGRLGTVIFTNKNVMFDNWGIVKRSANSSEAAGKWLPSAEFSLSRNPDGDDSAREMIYYGKSDAWGRVIWYEDKEWTQELTGSLPTGVYILAETKAPAGYIFSPAEWIITILDGKLVDIASSDQTEIEHETRREQNGSELTVFYFDNDIAYELPSAGGTGIYWYSIGGILLMMAGVSILYKNKVRGGAGRFRG